MPSAGASQCHAEVVCGLLAMWRWFKGVSGYPRGEDEDCVSDQPVPANTKRQPPSIVGQYCVVALVAMVMIGLVLWRLIRRMPFIQPDAQSLLIVKRGKQIRVVVLICFDT